MEMELRGERRQWSKPAPKGRWTTWDVGLYLEGRLGRGIGPYRSETHRLWVFSLADVDRVYSQHCSLPPAAGSGPSFYACEESNLSKQACSLGSC